MKLEIVDADLSREDHAGAVVSLLNEYSTDPAGGATELPALVRASLAAELRARSWAHVILALADETPAGLAICFEGFSTFVGKPLLNIHDLIVARSHRKRGIARAILHHAESLARRLGCCKLTLEVLTGNTAAQSLYRSCGYAPYQLDPKFGPAMFWQRELGD